MPTDPTPTADPTALEAAHQALENCGDESRMVHRDHLRAALAEVDRLTAGVDHPYLCLECDRPITQEQQDESMLCEACDK